MSTSDNIVLNEKVKLAVFDFDGTIIPLQSGVELARRLKNTKKFKKHDVAQLMAWAIRYKLHLPYKEDTAREIIFNPFTGKKASEVDEYIDQFYEEVIDPSIRPKLLEISKKLKVEGIELLVLSAAFTTTLKSFAKRHNDFTHIVGTDMEVDENGYYTGKVKGTCVAGDEKINSLIDYADMTFGKNNWELEYAFADHYTDKALLNKAKYVGVIDPDSSLERYAKKKKWKIIEFEKGK